MRDSTGKAIFTEFKGIKKINFILNFLMAEITENSSSFFASSASGAGIAAVAVVDKLNHNKNPHFLELDLNPGIISEA